MYSLASRSLYSCSFVYNYSLIVASIDLTLALLVHLFTLMYSPSFLLSSGAASQASCHAPSSPESGRHVGSPQPSQHRARTHAFADQPVRAHTPAPHAHSVRSLRRLVCRSLAFLHKKSWHTANLQNVEKVWAAEEEQKKEQQKLERWKKEREEERQQAELRSLQDEMTKTCRLPHAAPPAP